jgi:FkbM family methyltransferase
MRSFEVFELSSSREPERSEVSIKQRVIDLIPRRLELAARYNYNKALGRLEREMRIIEQIVSQRRRCIDIGANVGLYTYRFAHVFREVESFEPIPRCAKIIASSGIKNVHLRNCALSNRAGQATLNIPVTGGPEATGLASLSNQFPSAESLVVELRTLDSFVFSEVDLIKIDVEGHELEVLEGAVETIERELPTVLVEVEQRHHADKSIQSIFQFVQDLGYEGIFYWKGCMNPLTSFSVERHQQPFDPLNRVEYVNNFIFRSVRSA